MALPILHVGSGERLCEALTYAKKENQPKNDEEMKGVRC